MTNEQKDIATPAKTGANQNKDGQSNSINQKKEDGTTKPTETNEKAKPSMTETEKEREGQKHPHEVSEPVANKEAKTGK